MKNQEEYIKECKVNSECLEEVANFYSLLYTSCMLTAITVGIILLGSWIKDTLINFSVGAIGLLATVLPLVFKNNIEKIQGYRELAVSFKNLEQDFVNPSGKKSCLNELKRLRKKLSDYPPMKLFKLRALRKIKKEKNNGN